MEKDTSHSGTGQISIQRNRFPQRDCDLTKLPFVADVEVLSRRKERKFWHVPEVDCYATANIVGAQYAADWIQYLKDNPGAVGAGLMGWFAKEMYQGQRDDASHGIAVGFWVLIEQALAQAGDFDHYACADVTARRVQQYLTVDRQGGAHGR